VNVWSRFCEESLDYVGFDVLTAVVMKSTIFWNITPYSPLSVKRRFWGTYRLHLQRRKTKLSKKLAWKEMESFHAGFLLSLFFQPWRWRRNVPPKRRLTLNGLHGVTSQKMVLFITTAVRTSKKVKFSLCLIILALCHEDVWGSGGIASPFLTSALYGGEWSSSLLRRFTPGKEPPVRSG
jgi:hypothetical protein